MTLGTNNRKQLAILGALVLVMAYLVYTNLIATPDAPSRPSQRANAPAVAPIVPGVTPGQPAAAKRAASRTTSGEFHPVYVSKNPARRRDPKTIDPTLRTDLFAKVQAVELSGGARNLFAFAPPPPPKAEAPKPAGEEPTVYIAQGPRQPPPPPVEPPPPPITLKFYGFSTPRENGKKTAYLLDGEDIYIAAEGDTLKRRYKIVRINPTSILIEDLDAKRQQAVPLTEENAS
jgi:hypothetical protein